MVDNRPIITIDLGGFNADFLIDSGAARSLVTEQTLKLVNVGLSDGILLPGSQLRSISGHIVQTLGKVYIFLFGIKCEFFVVFC